jgi:hypothetical protein
MFLNRDQAVAMNCARSNGFDPVHAIVLTSHNRRLRFGIASVLAIKDGRRYNLRVSIDIKTCATKLISAFEINLVIDTKHSPDITTIDGCVIKEVVRRSITL